jgi:hypothetical protein
MAGAQSACHNIVVQNGELPTKNEKDRPILPWRFVGGAFLHCVVPAYLAAVVVDALLTARGRTTTESLMRHALHFTSWFLMGYALLALLGISSAMALDPMFRARRAKRASRDPQTDIRRSEMRVEDAVATGRELFGLHADTYLSTIQSLRWDHADHRFQSLSVDLKDVIAAASTAKAEASADRHPAIIATASATLGRIEAALGYLVAERGRRAEGDVEAVARYVEMRYGPSDFSGRPD